MRKHFFLFAILIFLPTIAFSQGKLLLIGGGSEKSTSNSWNKAAYTWAVDQSANKHVAVVAYGSAPDSWLTDYFVNSCGAVSATHFNISSPTTADAQSTYDNLIACDVIFIKGGDQYNYYSTYKNTKTAQAIADKFNAGGVICGTSAGLAILSGVVYTAQNGSAYPDECLINPNNSYVTLANDLFNFFPGYVFDTHFTIRGRFARLLGFMANWKFTQSEDINGIGIDEMTAMAIDENKIGTVYGIGSANLYKAFYPTTFSQSGTKLLADSVKVTQLLQGCSINFNTGEITGFSQNRQPVLLEEDGNYTIFASGADALAYNAGMLDAFVNQAGNATDQILIITGSNLATANSFKDELIGAGASDVEIYTANSTTASDAALESAINNAQKILFINNVYNELMAFVDEGTAGQALKSKIRSQNMITAFVGDNSRFIGHSIVTNYLDADAAYYGEFIIKPGLNLLKTTTIIPNTYADGFFENTNAAIPFAMITDTLAHGIWLNKNNYIKYQPNSEDKPHIYTSGSSPVMILKNKGAKTGFSVQTAYGDGLDDPPNFVGFENMTLSLIDETTPYQVGNSVDLTSSINTSHYIDSEFNIIYNGKELTIKAPYEEYTVNIFSLSGQLLKKYQYFGNSMITTTSLLDGFYLLRIQSKNGGPGISKKFLVSK
jgi:cyanophycinase